MTFLDLVAQKVVDATPPPLILPEAFIADCSAIQKIFGDESFVILGYAYRAKELPGRSKDHIDVTVYFRVGNLVFKFQESGYAEELNRHRAYIVCIANPHSIVPTKFSFKQVWNDRSRGDDGSDSLPFPLNKCDDALIDRYRDEIASGVANWLRQKDGIDSAEVADRVIDLLKARNNFIKA